MFKTIHIQGLLLLTSFRIFGSFLNTEKEWEGMQGG